MVNRKIQSMDVKTGDITQIEDGVRDTSIQKTNHKFLDPVKVAAAMNNGVTVDQITSDVE